MKIGVNANYFGKPSTGIGVVTLEFMRALAVTAEGKTHEWVWYYEGTVPAGEWPENWRFERVATWWTRDDLLHRYLWERFALPRRVKRDRCEVFFSLYQAATVLPVAMRHVMLVHDLIPKRFPEYLGNSRQRFHYRAIERGIRAADHVIAPSKATRDDLERLLAIPAAKITVAPLGVPRAFEATSSPADWARVWERYRLAPGYIYHGGGLERRKNTELLLRAYAKLVRSADQAPLPLLVISGTVHREENPLATPVRTLISTLGLTERVRLLGWVPDADLPSLYRGAAAFVYPSRYEGFGLPVLEAFASGTPVIATTAGSLAELVQDAAVTVAPDDIDGLGQAIHLLLSDPALRTTLGTKGQERAAEHTWPPFVSSILTRLLQ